MGACEYWMFPTVTWETRELHPRAEAPGFACVLPNPLRFGKINRLKRFSILADAQKRSRSFNYRTHIVALLQFS